MGKKVNGLFAAITLVTAGVAAIFLSKKENRQKAQVGLTKAAKTAKKVSSQIKRSKTAKAAQEEGRVVAKKAIRQVRKAAAQAKPAAKKLAKKAIRKSAKKTAKRA